MDKTNKCPKATDENGVNNMTAAAWRDEGKEWLQIPEVKT